MTNPTTTFANSKKPVRVRRRRKRHSSNVCRECGGIGHFQLGCASFSKRTRKSVDKPRYTTFMSAKGVTHRHGYVVMNSGASSHMTFAGNLLSDYQEFTWPETVSFANGFCATVMGIGELKLKITHNRLFCYFVKVPVCSGFVMSPCCHWYCSVKWWSDCRISW